MMAVLTPTNRSRASNQTMRPMICYLVLLLTGSLWAQSSPVNKTDKVAIERAKAMMVSSLDRGLPKVTLEYFLRYESNGAAIHWEVNDCSEQTGNPAADRRRNFPVCVEADFDVQRRTISVVVSVGIVSKGTTGTPALLRVTVTDTNGPVRSIKQLGSLPAELRRPLPHLPLDLQPPVGAL